MCSSGATTACGVVKEEASQWGSTIVFDGNQAPDGARGVARVPRLTDRRRRRGGRGVPGRMHHDRNPSIKRSSPTGARDLTALVAPRRPTMSSSPPPAAEETTDPHALTPLGEMVRSWRPVAALFMSADEREMVTDELFFAGDEQRLALWRFFILIGLSHVDRGARAGRQQRRRDHRRHARRSPDDPDPRYIGLTAPGRYSPAPHQRRPFSLQAPIAAIATARAITWIGLQNLTPGPPG